MVAMSGGVDSSLTAALLQEQGHDVTGVTMHLWEGDDERLKESLCCSQDMTENARRVCAQLDIPYYVFNYQREFRRFVIEYFLNDYAQGFTPNPCLACNRDVKFRALLLRAEALGFDYVATGHYAQVRQSPVGSQQVESEQPFTQNSELKTHTFALWRAVDNDKDQSYMLHMLQQKDLARLLFPIGAYSKAQVRAMAAERKLATADRPESQDICFVPGGDYRNMLREERPESIFAGPILDMEGHELGQHNGLPLYTIGQRKGLGIAVGQPLYVTALDTARNAVIVGPEEALASRELMAGSVTFVDEQWPTAPFQCMAQTRSHFEAHPAVVTPLHDQRVRVVFEQPERAITPGQAVVFYDGDRVLGGGRIVPSSEL
jgi:tRNA-specific 2-thiouridylase